MPTPGALAVFRHALTSIVEEMGLTLQRTAYSTNIKIRRDHTCALFDADLRHVAQHDVAPQHIGSLVSVVPDLVRERLDDLEPGDGLLVNDPAVGAVHLPDVMLISPIFVDDELVGVAVNSAHHVDIGGSTPGGIPTDSTELYAEGLVLPGIIAVRDWGFDDELLALVTRNVRDPRMRLGDYRAQLGANRTGARRFEALIEHHGRADLEAHIDELLAYTERRVRSAIEGIPDGEYRAADEMDGDGVVDEDEHGDGDGEDASAPISLELTLVVEGDGMTIDFTGTSPQNRGPLNCTPAMVYAGAMAVIMALVGEDLPKNDGFHRPFELVAPEGSMVNPSANAPVAGGWELAMRAGDLVTLALADAMPEATIAATKGVVCNVAYSGTDPRTDESYVFYETVAGGYGARATKDGMDGVQTHFQNTANSPIEELETELPVRVRRYELVCDSGGAGRTRGGLGVRRDVAFPGHEATFSLLSDRAMSRPWGLFGGRPGRSAVYVRDPEGRAEPLPSKSTTELDPGETVRVQTPGGGGYGDPYEREPARVLADVRAGKVSPEAAAEAYGVVVRREDGEVTLDLEATARRRAGGADREGSDR